MKRLAELAGVSRQAVSAVLNNRWKDIRLSEKTHDKIEAVIRQTQFHPSSLGRALALQRSQLIGVVTCSVNYCFFPEALQGIEDMAEEKGCGLLVMTTRNSDARQEQTLQFMLDRHVEGLLLHSFATISPAMRMRLRDGQTPVVYFAADSSALLEGSLFACTDGQTMGTLGIEHLIHRGHRHIVGVDLMECLCEGIAAAIRNSSVPIRFDCWRRLSCDDVYRRWKTMTDRPTALFFMGDDVANRFLNIALREGIRVPDELAILGTDDMPIAADAVIPLSTIAQPKYEQGHAAARMLFDLIDGKAVRSTVLSPSLIIRKTT